MTGYDTPFLEPGASLDPIEQFRLWYEEASALLRAPEAAAVATVDAACRPSVRMVLVKSIDERGFVFYTSSLSRKSRAISERSVAALLFYWEPLGRQVRIEGPVEQVSAEESDAYFATRPRGSQISARASRQSEPVPSRDELEAAHAAVTLELEDREVPRPSWWGGYRLVPHELEFWQNRSDRLHDRLRYRLEHEHWVRQRLQP